MDEPIRDTGLRVGVAPIRAALADHPEVWNRHTGRTSPEDSPHHEVDDIFIRFAAPGADVTRDYDSVWYEPMSSLIGVRTAVYDLARHLHADRIGGVLITRIPPGKSVHPHIDRGWHAGYYRKYGIQIASAPGQAFCFDGVRFESEPGDVYEFRNDVSHWVKNDSSEERITMIVCLRLEQSVEWRI